MEISLGDSKAGSNNRAPEGFPDGQDRGQIFAYYIKSLGATHPIRHPE
jgi:hypothetical protein